MPYNQNIPRATDVPADSRADIQGNFAAIKQLIDTDHVTFDAVGEGKHKKVTLPISVAGPTTVANELSLYTKTVSGVTQLFYKRDVDTTEYQLTSGGGPTPSGSTFWTKLPNGLVMKWGQAQGNGPIDINLAAAGYGAAYKARVYTSVTPSYRTGYNTNMFAYPRLEATDSTNANTLRVYCVNRTTGANMAVWFTFLTIGTI